MPTAIYLSTFLSFALVALLHGAAIHKRSKGAGNGLNEMECLTLSDGARLGFQNKDEGFMANRLVDVGERVELRCQVVGAPQATIRWKFNGQFIEKEVIGDHHAQIENGDLPIIGISTTISLLTIACADSETAGQYTCVAENGCSETIETSAIVAVKQADTTKKCPLNARSLFGGVAPQIVLWTDSRLERPEAAVTLFCRATGSPQPTIEWFEEDDAGEYQKIASDETHMLLKNGDLLIRGEKNKDEAKPSVAYKCVATNEHGSDSFETIIIRADL
uniref:Ig-like domain-containing protein n=1 Tax=Plectus sambesii TaxID=2011161 RepID=A0A914VFX8_9BILA